MFKFYYTMRFKNHITIRIGFLWINYVETGNLLNTVIEKLERTFKNIDRTTLANKPVQDCNDIGLDWHTGKIIFEYSLI
jgi:hypothetical protein